MGRVWPDMARLQAREDKDVEGAKSNQIGALWGCS